jgi:small-conductance mechanosensitive channel
VGIKRINGVKWRGANVQLPNREMALVTNYSFKVDVGRVVDVYL